MELGELVVSGLGEAQGCPGGVEGTAELQPGSERAQGTNHIGKLQGRTPCLVTVSLHSHITLPFMPFSPSPETYGHLHVPDGKTASQRGTMTCPGEDWPNSYL